MLVWSLINCLIPLLPAIVIWMISWLVTRSGQIFRPFSTITGILGDGQLFFYSISLCVATLSDLLYKVGTINSDNVVLTPEDIKKATEINNQNLTVLIVFSVLLIFLSLFYGAVMFINISLAGESDEEILNFKIKTTLVSFILSILATFFVLIARYYGGLF
jgi:uncharacterized membrane protein